MTHNIEKPQEAPQAGPQQNESQGTVTDIAATERQALRDELSRLKPKDAHVLIVEDHPWHTINLEEGMKGLGVGRPEFVKSKEGAIHAIEKAYGEGKLPSTLVLDMEFLQYEGDSTPETMGEAVLEYLSNPSPIPAGVNREEYAEAIRRIPIVMNTTTIGDEEQMNDLKQKFPTLTFLGFTREKSGDGFTQDFTQQTRDRIAFDTK